MARFNQGNIVLTNNEKIIQGGQEVLGSNQAATVASLQVGSSQSVTNISNDGTLSGDSTSNLVTEQAIKNYVDDLIYENETLYYFMFNTFCLSYQQSTKRF